MARRARLHVPEDFSDADMSRPIFDRPIGRVGIYVELCDAEPIEHIGSHVYFRRETEEKLNMAIRKVALDKVKGTFERRCLLNDVIFEEYHDNLIISVSFEDPAAVGNLWNIYERELVGPCLQESLVTAEVMAYVGVKSLTLECRLWEDEIEACEDDIRQSKVCATKLESCKRDQALIKKVKKYMPTLAEHLMMLKDQLTKFDKILGEFIMIMKQNMPKGVEQINTYEELLELFDKIKKNKPEAKHGRVLNVYTKVRDCIKATAAEFEDHIMHTLLQVHAHCESSYQQQLKSKMRSAIREMNTHLQPSYNFYNLNHKEWQSKVLFKEQKLFLGPISVLAKSVSTLVDADVQMDEYLSSLTVKIKV